MTPLRFRAYDKEQGIMMSHEDIDRSDKEGIIMWGDLFNGKEKEIVVMRSTGRKDRSGKEVFEGDIVTFCKYGRGDQKGIGEVWWQDVLCAFVIDWRDEEEPTPAQIQHSAELEIIGNIYENPDLLPKAA